MDKSQLRNCIIWNCMNNEESGLVEEDVKTNELLETILGILKEKRK